MSETLPDIDLGISPMQWNITAFLQEPWGTYN